MIYLHKLLPLIVSPLGLILLLLFINLWSRRRWITGVALAVLFISSFPLTASLIWYGLEKQYPYVELSTLREHDAVVVLSGMLDGFKADEKVVSEWDDPDRFFAGIRVVDQGVSDYLIFTRGKLPWGNLPPEGEVLRDHAISMGVPADRILLTGEVENTAQEAEAVRVLMESHGLISAILVTSSFHMPRAQMLFERAGVSVEPYAVDFKGQNRSLTLWSFIPSADAFWKTSSGIREYMGRLYYWLRFSI